MEIVIAPQGLGIGPHRLYIIPGRMGVRRRYRLSAEEHRPGTALRGKLGDSTPTADRDGGRTTVPAPAVRDSSADRPAEEHRPGDKHSGASSGILDRGRQKTDDG